MRRQLGTFGSVKVNNLFLFVGLLVWGALESRAEPVSAEPLILLMTVLLLFPLASDPLAIIPPERLALWPLSLLQRTGLRLASLLVSPIVWIALGTMVFTGHSAVAVLLIGFSLLVNVSPRWNALRGIPQPPGKLGGLVQSALREMLTVLDVYAALLLSVGGTAYRFLSARPDPLALPISAMLAGLALSTYAQSLFGLDMESSALLRYRLLPLPGWQILAAKDLAYLAILTVLVAPLHPGAGLTFGFVALTIGHHTSVRLPMPHRRWRFTGGRVLPGVLQCVLGAAAGLAEYQHGPVVLLAAASLCAASLWLYGRGAAHLDNL